MNKLHILQHIFCRLVITIFLIQSISAEKILFRADSMTGNTGDATSKATLLGNANITTETMEIFADKIELSGDNYRYVKATGNVSGSNNEKKIDFTCGELLYDRKNKYATMQESVHLVDKKNETVANAELMDYDENHDTVVMQISVAMQQKDNICSSSYAIYNTESRLLFLSGNPQLTQGKDTFRAQDITLNLDTNEVTLDGRVRGTVSSKDN